MEQRQQECEERMAKLETVTAVHDQRLNSGARRFAEQDRRGVVAVWLRGLTLAGMVVAIGVGLKILNATDSAETAVRATVQVQQVQARQGAQIDALGQEVKRQGAAIDGVDNKLDRLLLQQRKGGK